MNTTGTHDWYTVVSFGGDGGAPSGPWRGEDTAIEALGRWQDRKGYLAGSLVAAHSISVVGPFCSRAAARNADISDWPSHVCRHDA